MSPAGHGTSEFELALSLLREEVAGSALLPKGYARYRPLLADGLYFFLRRLSPARLRDIFTGQMSLSASAGTAERLVALLHHVPALHKLGQVVARDRRLAPGFRRRLQQLESLEPMISAAEVVQLLGNEFPGWEKAGIKLEPKPLAEGSVAVIMPFVWEPNASRLRRNTGSSSFHSPPRPRKRPFWENDYDFESEDEEDMAKPPCHGVFKLLKPGIQALLEEDLAILGHLGDFLDGDCARYHLPALDYHDTFNTITELLLHEVRLDEEQRHLAEAARMYASAPRVLIPALFPFCSARLTAMQRVRGVKLAESHLPRGLSRRALARTTVQRLIAQPLFAPQPAALFHADPHAGNLIVTPAGRLAILDWSLAGRLSKQARVALIQLLVGALGLDAEQMGRVLAALLQTPPDQAAMDNVLRAGLRALRWRAFPGIAWLIDLLDRLVIEAGVRMGGDLLLFRKALLTLEGVLADLLKAETAEYRSLLDQAVWAAFLRHWAAEWPSRFRVPLTSRAFTTHLSTADLLQLAWSSPMVAARWWGQTSLDLLQTLDRAIMGSSDNRPAL